MKKLVVLLLMVGLPCFADVVIEGDSTTKTFKEYQINSIVTTSKPSYGVIVNLKDGRNVYIQSSTRGDAVRMLQMAYMDLQSYYNWSDSKYYNMIETQDKAHLGL